MNKKDFFEFTKNIFIVNFLYQKIVKYKQILEYLISMVPNIMLS